MKGMCRPLGRASAEALHVSVRRLDCDCAKKSEQILHKSLFCCGVLDMPGTFIEGSRDPIAIALILLDHLQIGAGDSITNV